MKTYFDMEFCKNFVWNVDSIAIVFQHEMATICVNMLSLRTKLFPQEYVSSGTISTT